MDAGRPSSDHALSCLTWVIGWVAPTAILSCEFRVTVIVLMSTLFLWFAFQLPRKRRKLEAGPPQYATLKCSVKTSLRAGTTKNLIYWRFPSTRVPLYESLIVPYNEQLIEPSSPTTIGWSALEFKTVTRITISRYGGVTSCSRCREHFDAWASRWRESRVYLKVLLFTSLNKAKKASEKE